MLYKVEHTESDMRIKIGGISEASKYITFILFLIPFPSSWFLYLKFQS